MTAALQSSKQASPVRLSHCRRHNGMAGLTPSDRAERASAKPVLPLPQLHYWQAELNFWQLEVNFFHRLLTLGISNCPTCERSRVKDLLLAFACFKDGALPRLRTSVEEVLLGSPERNGLHSATLLQEIEQQAEDLKKLKLEVFPRLAALTPAIIW